MYKGYDHTPETVVAMLEHRGFSDFEVATLRHASRVLTPDVFVYRILAKVNSLDRQGATVKMSDVDPVIQTIVKDQYG